MATAATREAIETASATKSLADFVERTSLSDVPERVRARAKLLLLDAIGCALGGTRTDLGTAAVRALYGQSRGRSTCVGQRTPIAARDAALLNAILINALDYDDDNGVGHPSASVLPAALAVAEEQAQTGGETLLAYVLGYEVSSRVGRAIWPSPERYEAVWGVGTHQTLGAVAAAAKLYGLEGDRLLNAFGIAGSAAPVPSALKWNWESRPLGWVKDAVAWPAQSGVMSATLARHGFEASRDILDGPHGFWVMASSDRFEPDIITDGLGEHYFVAESATKPYPSCRFTHSMLEAIQRVVRTHGLQADEVDEVTVRSVTDVREYLSDPDPQSSVDAQFSAHFTAALMLQGITPGPDWFAAETLHDSRVRDMARRVRLVANPQFDRDFQADQTNIPATVSVITHDGRELSDTVAFPRGEQENPIPDCEVQEKFRSLAEPVIGGAAATRVQQTIAELEQLQDIGRLTAELRSRD
jgi:2-methylcitrate dehydratase PrpD